MPNIAKEDGKMTLTINTQLYGKLLAEFQPQVITTEAENKRAIALAENLAHKPNLTPEENRLLELLITLIEKFESETYSLGHLSTPLSRLLFLIETNPLSDEEITNIFTDKALFSAIITGEQAIDKPIAVKLGQQFGVNSTLFI